MTKVWYNINKEITMKYKVIVFCKSGAKLYINNLSYDQALFLFEGLPSSIIQIDKENSGRIQV